MPHQTKHLDDHPVSAHQPQWEIGSFLRYEQERPDIVSITRDWEGEVPRKTNDAVIQILQGDYPANVFLAELPRAQGWTRKLKLFIPGQEGCIVNVIGGGAPRLLLGDDVVYQLPNPTAKRRAATYRHFLADKGVTEEALMFDEVQGGLSLPLANLIHERMTHAAALVGDSVAVPTLLARGHLSIPRWDGAFLVYSEALNYRPRHYLRPEYIHQKFNGKRGLEIFLAGVRNLFQILRQINKHEDGMFHMDLVHRLQGGSANVGFTPDGKAVIKGWGRRITEQIGEWPSSDRRTYQLREVIGALAGLLQDVSISGIRGEQRHRLLVDIVWAGLGEYTDRYGKIDRVSLASGFPSNADRFVKSTRTFLSEGDSSDDLLASLLYQESRQLENGVKHWLIECVTHYV